MKKSITTIVLFSLVAIMPCVYCQSLSDLEKIAASQGGSLPLIYTVNREKTPDIDPEGYYNERECTVRNGLPNFFGRIKAGKDVTVAFIGGSITQGLYCYRMQISKYIEDQNTGIRFKWINAGVSGTGTDLGAFRIEEQVLQYNPDLIFIEFAVNGGYPDGMEGMIRKTARQNPSADICLIYAIYTGLTEVYQKGEIPLRIQKLEKIADHYSLPSIHLGMEAAYLERSGKLLWKGAESDARGNILFSNDGIHPLTAGGNLYAVAIARGLNKMMKTETSVSQHDLPPNLTDDPKWENANMYKPEQIAEFDSDWEEVMTSDHTHLKKFDGWFDTVMTSARKGASFSFRFEGDMFGIFDIGGPEVGQCEIWIDGKRACLNDMNIEGTHLLEADNKSGKEVLNRFNAYCNNRYRGQYDVIVVDEGIHEVTISISTKDADKKTILGTGRQDDIKENPQKYDRTVIYLGRILLRGKPLK